MAGASSPSASAPAAPASAAPAVSLSPVVGALVDIGANLLDDQFAGSYHGGAPAHPPDLEHVLARAARAGLSAILVTGTDLFDSIEALALCRAVAASGEFAPLRLHCTVGVHPTRAGGVGAAAAGGRGGGRPRGAAELLRGLLERSPAAAAAHARSLAAPAAAALASPPASPEAYRAAVEAALVDGLADGTAVAVGECGLDGDRERFALLAVQRRELPWQLDLAWKHDAPLFLHDRNAGAEVLDAVAAAGARAAAAGRAAPRGVVHSFTGSAAAAAAAVAAGLFIGVNGCSLKTRDACDVVAGVPLASLLLETDAPWCSIRATSPAFGHVKSALPAAPLKAGWAPGRGVKDRCEPASLVGVCEAVAGVRGDEPAALAAATTANARRLFGLGGSGR